MKFITGIKKVELHQKAEIKLPMYHRTSISFFNESWIYYITRTFISNGSEGRELILTPLIPDSWHRLRKITINTVDSPGIINVITSKLRDLKINVNIQEALSNQSGALHTLTLITDLTFFLKAEKYNLDEKIPIEAITKIETELKSLTKPMSNELIITENGVLITELTFLESISNIPDNESSCYISHVQFRRCNGQQIQNKCGKIELSREIIKSLNLDKQSVFYYTLFSDTEEKYIKIVFFDPNQTVAFIDVHHEDIYGAIAEFTEIIYSKHKFNIIASYSHQQMQKKTAHWFALIDLGSKQQEFFNETLQNLQQAKYLMDDTPSKALNVFLLETNSSAVEEGIIKKFGQNRITKDGSCTSVYMKKKSIVTDILTKKGELILFKKAPHTFLEKNGLQDTNSMLALINLIINEQKQTELLSFKKILIWTVSILIPVSLLSLLVAFNPKVKSAVIEAINHFASIGLVLLAVLLALIIRNFIEKNIERLSK